MQVRNPENPPNSRVLALRGDKIIATPEGYDLHDPREKCPTCGNQLLQDRLTGSYLSCGQCGWRGL